MPKHNLDDFSAETLYPPTLILTCCDFCLQDIKEILNRCINKSKSVVTEFKKVKFTMEEVAMLSVKGTGISEDAAKGFKLEKEQAELKELRIEETLMNLEKAFIDAEKKVDEEEESLKKDIDELGSWKQISKELLVVVVETVTKPVKTILRRKTSASSGEAAESGAQKVQNSRIRLDEKRKLHDDAENRLKDMKDRKLEEMNTHLKLIDDMAKLDLNRESESKVIEVATQGLKALGDAQEAWHNILQERNSPISQNICFTSA
jgi:hypothetical protein